MADPRFFTCRGPLSIARICELTGATAAPLADGNLLIEDVAPLAMATSGHLSFLDNTKYLTDLGTSEAGFCLLRAEHTDKAPKGMILLVSDNPYKAYALAAQAFYDQGGTGGNISPGAFVDSSAEVGNNVRIDAGAVVGPGVVIGSDCVIGAGASVSHCLIGNNVRIYPGVRIGQDGFGFAPDPAGHVKVPQLGRVIVEDNVEIGANTCIDRGAGPDTIIGAGTWIDNLVQIGHNVIIGKRCLIVAQVGISGSVSFEDDVIVGGQAGFAGHLSVGQGAKIAAQAGITKNVESGAFLKGNPALPYALAQRIAVLQRKLPDLFKRFADLDETS